MIEKLTFEQINLRHAGIRPDARYPIAVFLENVRSAYNVGAVLRTADAAYLESVYCAGITADPSHRRVVKTALGAQETVPWSRDQDAPALATALKNRGYTLAALEITTEPTSWDAIGEIHFPLCLVVGNEVSGVSESVLGLCDMALEIPQFGEKHSLNVAVAAGIAVYKLLERFKGEW